MPDESQLHDRAIVDKAVSALMVHFDAVHIFVTRHEADSTMSYAAGKGNWYSRIGMINEWLDSPTVSELEEDD